jgi:hypothetical protein
MTTQLFYRLSVSVAVLLVAGQMRAVNTALDAVPQCRNDVAAECCQNAVQSVQPSSCNWNIIMPILVQCVSGATLGCPTLQIAQWQQVLVDFNNTLYTTACASACPNPDQSAAAAQQCFAIVDTVTTFGYTALEDLVAYIIRLLPIVNQDACRLLGAAVDCLNIATAGCAALMDQAYQRLDAVNTSTAIGACNVSKVVTPTTSQPLAIFNSVSVPQTTMTGVNYKAAILIGEGSQSNMSTVWTILIVIAGAIVVAIIAVIGFLLQRTFSYRREAKKLGRLLGNEQQTKPDWREVTRKQTQTMAEEPSLPPSSWPVTGRLPRGNFSSRPRSSSDLFYRAT